MTENLPSTPNQSNSVFNIIVIVAALGYLVDIYDLILFSIVRVQSLKDIGITDPTQIADTGLLLLNWQMAGMLLGGVLWGISGDKFGRISVLFGSILLYSMANIANGFVQTVEQYEWLRFIAGIGLAGELGAGITLVSEVMTKESRGYGTTLVATVGMVGAVMAYFVAKTFDWRTAYFVGGGLGLLLLVLRVSAFESGMYKNLSKAKVKRGNLLHLFNNKRRAFRYINCILIGLPTWFVVGILVTLTPEFAKNGFGMANPPKTGAEAVLYCYIGLTVGDLVTGVLSQVWKSRRKVMFLFHGISMLTVLFYLYSGSNISLNMLYFKCFLLGFGVGFWAVFVTMASESFGTNLRATTTTTVPNMARGFLVPITALFLLARNNFGYINGALIVGLTSTVIAVLAVYFLDETYGKNLDYVEE